MPFGHGTRRSLREDFSARHAFDNDQMTQCLASVFWRASQSISSCYSGASLNNHHQDLLLDIVREPRADALRKCSVRINRLLDRTPKENGGFSQRVISNFVLTPHSHTMSAGKKRRTNHFGFDIVMLGFLCIFIVPRASANMRVKPGFLRRGGDQLHAPPIDLFEYPRIKQTLVNAYAKKKAGMSNIEVE